MGAARGLERDQERHAQDDPAQPAAPVRDGVARIAVPHSCHDSSKLKPKDALESWRHVMSGSYEVPAPQRDALPNFRVRAEAWHLGGMMVTRVSHAAPLSASRPPQRVRGDHVDHYGLVLQLDGAFRLDAKGEDRLAQPGQLIFTDLARPQVRNDHDPGTYLMVFVPREVLDEALPHPVDLHGLAPRAGIASMLALHVQNLVGHLPSMDVRQAADITTATVAMIAAALTPSAATREAARPAIEATLLRQISRYVELHLTDPGLTPQSICSAFRISRTALYRLFEPTGGVAAFVRERRLVAIRDKLLAQQRSRTPLHELAERYGFSSPSHLSNSYRQLFGHRPSEARVGAAHVMPQRFDAPNASSFNDWLKSLRG